MAGRLLVDTAAPAEEVPNSTTVATNEASNVNLPSDNLARCRTTGDFIRSERRLDRQVGEELGEVATFCQVGDGVVRSRVEVTERVCLAGDPEPACLEVLDMDPAPPTAQANRHRRDVSRADVRSTSGFWTNQTTKYFA